MYKNLLPTSFMPPHSVLSTCCQCPSPYLVITSSIASCVQAAIPVYADCVALGTTAISREEFVHEWQGQVALLTTQMAWTAESEAAISRFAASLGRRPITSMCGDKITPGRRDKT